MRYPTDLRSLAATLDIIGVKEFRSCELGASSPVVYVELAELKRIAKNRTVVQERFEDCTIWSVYIEDVLFKASEHAEKSAVQYVTF